jgi:DNA-binding NtrC family response regulator
VLVLEDEAGFQALLSEVLGGAGHEVLCAESGAEAMKLMATNTFDLLLLDFRLPGETGLDFLEHFRMAGQQAPVIIMTAFAEVPVVVEAMRLGAVDFLVKPFSLDTLLPLVERCLRNAPTANAE